MTRAFSLFLLVFFINGKMSGQCTNSPTVNLSSAAGTSCGTASFTLSGNTFGGSATRVTITENGSGTISPGSSTSSPYSFTYIPRTSDIGKKVTITVTTNDPKGKDCSAVKATYTLTISEVPAAPVVGTITKPTCTISTGSVALSGLPSSGTWTLTRSPGDITQPGSGTNVTITGLPSGTYNYKVTSAAGCITASSANIIIPTPPVQAVPVIGTITAPTCIVATGSVQISGLPPAGTWTLTRYPGTIVTRGSGQTVTLSGIQPGLYNYTVTTEGGCTSGLTANVVIPVVTNTPSAPAIGAITQPLPSVPTGSVILNNLPGTGTWTLTQTPGNISIPGSGVSVTISGLQPGVYNYKVTNAENCISGLSETVTIGLVTSKPVVVITFPAPVCFPATVDLTDPKITAGSAPDLLLSYWTDASATIQFTTPKTATAGAWYIKGSMPGGTYDIKPVIVTIYHAPVAKAGADQVLTSQTRAQLDANPINDFETGLWSIITGSGTIIDPGNPKTSVDALSEDKNIFVWQVTNGVCQASLDTVVITIRSHIIPSLITPNMDGRNDYLVIKGFNSSERIQLIVFDRRGIQVFKSDNYDNRWNGSDMFGKPLEDDTYFYVLKIANKSLNGYFLIKR